ncbi:hypothetical protein BS78_03G050200 [Paspalum vaginatum]|nr:hypothetical protein BS78_03G050200 [Paspalum vaginatum]
MTNILFPANFLHKIDSIMRNFWWTGIQEESSTHHIAFRARDDICKPKALGGLGLKKMALVNRSLVLHSAWMIVNGKDHFLTNILKSKYFHNCSFWKSNIYGPKSVFWSSIQGVKNDLVKNTSYQLFSDNVNIWSQPWCPIWENIHDHIKLPTTVHPLPNKVKDLWYPNSNSWNNELITNVFPPQAAEIIKETPVVPANEPDTLVWKPEKGGQCTTKEAIRYFVDQEQMVLPSYEGRRLTQQANSLLQVIWKSKCIQPNLKTFMWRILRQAIPTGQRVSVIVPEVNNLCKHCTSPKNDLHLFFKCPFSRAVWFTCNYPMRTDSILDEEDGLQQTLTHLIPTHINHDMLANIILTLWYIWRARND